MPRNAANKDVLALSAGRSLKFRVKNNRQISVSGRAYNPSFDTDLQFKLQNAPLGKNEVQTITLAGTTLAGSIIISFDGKTTGAITWSATQATFEANVVAGLLALSLAFGYSTNQFRAKTTSHSANGSTITIMAINSFAARNVSPFTVDITSLTGGSPTAVVATTTQGVTAGGVTGTDVTADGRASATLTVKPRATLPFSYGVDDDSSNALGPYINIVGVAGIGELQLDWDDAHVDSIVL